MNIVSIVDKEKNEHVLDFNDVFVMQYYASEKSLRIQFKNNKELKIFLKTKNVFDSLKIEYSKYNQIKFHMLHNNAKSDEKQRTKDAFVNPNEWTGTYAGGFTVPSMYTTPIGTAQSGSTVTIGAGTSLPTTTVGYTTAAANSIKINK